MGQTDTEENKLNPLNLLVLVLSVYVLLALLVDTIFKVSPEVSKILELVDNGICVFFLIEFSIRFYKAESKLKFMKWGWIDLISSIPSIDFLRIGRLFSLMRLLRIIRAIRSTKELIRHFKRKRVESTIISMFLLGILLLIFSSILILKVEDVPGGNIKTASDALWWGFTTISTIGYGELYPITTAGRLIASVLIIFGVGIFGTLSGLIASWFLGQKRQ